MASAQTTEVFNCSPEQFFAVVTDYESYPEFLQEVKACKIIKSESERKLVEFSVSVIKSFKYSLWMTEKAPTLVSWEFASGDIFKTSTGSWKIEPEGGKGPKASKCRTTYAVDATFNMFVPGPVAKALVNVNLPTMIAAYQKRVAELYGR